MMEVLEFTFQSFWHWAGMLFLISAFGTALGATLAGLRGKG